MRSNNIAQIAPVRIQIHRFRYPRGNLRSSHFFFMIVVHTRQADLKISEAATMQTPEVSSPANTIDVTSDDDISDKALPHKRSHGGRRNTKRYGDKLLALEPDNIRYFLANKRCYCGKIVYSNCITRDERGSELCMNCERKDLSVRLHHDTHQAQIHAQIVSPPGCRLASS